MVDEIFSKLSFGIFLIFYLSLFPDSIFPLLILNSPPKGLILHKNIKYLYFHFDMLAFFEELSLD